MSRSYKNIKSWRQRTKARMIDAMGGKCVCCGYNREASALEFHHLDRSIKTMTFGNVKVNNWSLIVEELRGCVLLCANCHREVERGLIEIPNNPARFNEDFAIYDALQYKKVGVCEECAIEFRKNRKASRFCSLDCAILSNRRVKNRPPVEEILELTGKLGFEAVGRMYNVTGNTIRKWVR